MSGPSPEPGGVSSAAEMRRRAEATVASRIAAAASALQVADVATMTPEERETILHELRVHQVELEMQNEELSRAQAALEAARARYFDLYDLAPVGYITLSEKNLILEANLHAATLLGLTRSELVRQPITRWIAPEDQDAFYRGRAQCLETGGAQSLEIRLRRPDGGLHWARMDVTAGDPDRTPSALVYRMILTEITDQKRAEEERSRLLLDESAARRAAELALNQRNEFISAASHELRTPLGALMIQVEGMKKAFQNQRLDAAQTERGLDLIERQASRMVRLINNLLYLSKHQGDQSEMRRTRCDLAQVTREVVERHASEMSKAGCPLELALAADAHGLWDKDALEQVIENLLANAIKFGAGKPIRIAVSADEAGTKMTIGDEGIGIPADQLTSIFEPYTRAHSARHLGGLGLGLAIARKIVEAHGGTLSAENAPTKGAIITLLLPPS